MVVINKYVPMNIYFLKRLPKKKNISNLLLRVLRGVLIFGI